MAIKKNRMFETEDRNKKIEMMNLAELKQYLCMKNNQNPEKCVICPGLRNCTAGQRATILLGELECKKVKKPERSTVTRARLNFIKTLNQPDMIRYLMESCGNTREAARQKLKNWSEKFPDVAKEYDFEEKYVQCVNASCEKKREIAKAKFDEAITHSDPVAFCMEKYGWDYKQARDNVRNWTIRYGEGTKVEKADEISVEEFLKENTIQESKKIEEPKCEVKRETPKPFLDEVNAKYNELKMEKERLENRLAWIEKAQDALAMTLNIFDPETAIAKGIFGE